MSEPTSLHGVGQIARNVSDLAKSVIWYSEVLGLTHLYTFASMAFFDCGGTRLMLAEVSKPESDALPAESILYFSTRDIASSADALTANGVEFIQAPQLVHQHDDGTQEWMGFFNDPDGRPFGLMEQRTAS